MSVVHLATELSGGAGGFVRHLHLAMQGLGQSSLVVTRERHELPGVVTVKPMGRLAASWRAHRLNLLGRLGVVDTSYALFGVERNPVDLGDIRRALGGPRPMAFIFYWISYFIGFDTILALRRAYPDVPLLLVCTDEALLTGGCHYSHGCTGYETSCAACPALTWAHWQRQLESGYLSRRELVRAIDPLVIYPTTNIYDMGQRSMAMRDARAHVLPLGAISEAEVSRVREIAAAELARGGECRQPFTLLVRASTEPRKGCDLFVDALRLLQARMPDLRSRLRVISIGDDALTQAGIERYVTHEPMGYVGRADLLNVYGRSDAFIVTSREDGGPLMTNECVALGIPVISTPIGVARDLIVDARGGVITADISAQAICDALLSFLAQHRGHPPSPLQGRAELTFEGYIGSLLNLIEVEKNRLADRKGRGTSLQSE